jgi:hypothetical protein
MRITAIVGVLVLSALPLTTLRGTGAVLFALLASTTLALTGAVTCSVAARRVSGRPRAGWILLAAACGSWGLGNAYWSHNELLMLDRKNRPYKWLRRGDLSVTEVCLEVGCSSLGSFSARFTQLVGETPTAYRARDHGALESVPGCIAKDLTRPNYRSREPSRIGEADVALAP